MKPVDWLTLDPAPGSEQNFLACELAREAGGAVRLTRRADQELSVRQRTFVAGRARATVVVFYHRDPAQTETRIGYDASRRQSVGLASCLSTLFDGALLEPLYSELFGRRDRSMHDRPVAVLFVPQSVPAPFVAHALMRLAERLAVPSSATR